MKRSGYISWDEFFMGVALLAAKRSKDPNTQVGACIVDKNNIILSTGDTKYSYVVHAELNAILNAQGKDLHGARLYVDLFPCNECAKAIIQSGISEVVYLYDKYSDTPQTVASKRMLSSAGVKLTRFEAPHGNITLDFDANK